MLRLARLPFLWFAAFAVWFGTLWWLSSKENVFPPDAKFEVNDKVLHFGYFLGGGFLFSALLFRLDPDTPNWRRILLLTLLIVGLTGVLDEFHQSFVPNRSGNDAADLTADLIGALCGALVFRKLHRLVA